MPLNHSIHQGAQSQTEHKPAQTFIVRDVFFFILNPEMLLLDSVETEAAATEPKTPLFFEAPSTEHLQREQLRINKCFDTFGLYTRTKLACGGGNLLLPQETHEM